MRNLQLIDSLRIGDALELEGTKFVSVDFDTKDVYCTTDSAIFVINSATQEVRTGVTFAENIPSADGASVVGAQHLPDQMSLCVAFSSGDIILWNVTTKECDCVGTVESGIQAMEWSPDHEVIVIVTGGRTLIIMTRDFDAVTEVPLEQSGFGEAEFITVGWGKKETQFHGSVGKQAALVKSEAVTPIFSWDDKNPRISWRGDGQYFVISFISTENGGRILRTWTREGVLHSTSETVNGIEQSLSWKPSGSLIATTQRKPNTHDLVFFERNGLRHGEFTLPFKTKEVIVKEVAWNTESTVLLVWCEEMDEQNTEDWCPKSWLQLWTVNNYHWYLKQSLEFNATKEDKVSAVCWDPEHAYTLHVVCNGGQYIQYRWFWKTNRSEEESAQVAVIDGAQLLMTAFDATVVPPPMSAYSIQSENPIQSMFFGDENIMINKGDSIISYYLFAEGSEPDETIHLGGCGGNGFITKCKTPVLSSKLKLEGQDMTTCSYPLQFYHFLSLSKTQFIFASLSLMGNTSVIYRCHFGGNIEVNQNLVIEDGIDVEGRVLVMAYHSHTHNIVVQLTDGSLYKLSTDTWELSEWRNNVGEIIQFSQPCPHMEFFILGGEEVVIGMTERFRLFINNIQVATNCTSFAVHEEFLLLTTHSHTLRCISRKTKLSAVSTLSDGKAHPFDESVRRIERGSRIICVVPNETKVVLQMPRGNLETIHPRALVLASVRKHLNKLEFEVAFVLMKKHRINMNLLYDHDPELFLDNVEMFINKIDNSTHLNLFISELQEEDVTETMYTATYQRNKDIAPQAPSADLVKMSKVDKVCDAMKEALIKVDYNKFLLSIITAHVKKTTPELDQALHCIQNLKGDNQGNSRAEEALKYLLFLVDVNELYDVALGTYDFDLVLMVAEKSQKDPKEYLPFLNNLRRLEENYQKFTIDRYLKKYRSALKNIVLAGANHFEECLQLVKEHRLFAEALELYHSTSVEYQTIANAYGDYLTEKRYHEEAGLVFIKGLNLTKAQEQFEKCLDWRNCMSVSTKLGYGKEKLGEMSRSLATRLKDERRNSEASVLLEQYAEDPEEAIVTLIQGHLWDEALRTMYKYGREDFIETDLRPAIIEAIEQQLQVLDEQKVLFNRRCKRLTIVREQKEKKRLELIEGGGEHRPDADLYSDTSSATGDSVISDDNKSRGGQSRKSGSIYTKVSGTSRKARRKAEGKKKWSLKEGSKFEDFAIIESLAQIIKHVDSLRGEISSLLKTSVQFNYEKQARQLQVEYEKLLTVIHNTISDIWDSSQLEINSELPSFGPESTANTIALAMQQGVLKNDGQKQDLDPVLRLPPSLQKDTSWKLNILSRTTDK